LDSSTKGYFLGDLSKWSSAFLFLVLSTNSGQYGLDPFWFLWHYSCLMLCY